MADAEKLAALREKIERYHTLEAKECYENSLSEFLQGGWSSIDSAIYQQCWAIDAICDHLEAVTLGQIPRLLINVPPRCSKTTVASICWPAWTWARAEESYWSGSKVKFLCGSYNGVLAMSSANTMRRLLLSPWYQKYWGGKFELTEDQNTKAKFDNTLGGSRQSTSVSGSLLGLGGDIVICLPYKERVLTNQGWLPIGQLVEQQLSVKIAGEYQGSVIWQDVEKYEKNPGRETVRICWDSGSLRCTEDHLVFVEGRGYIKAKEVAVGDCVWAITLGSLPRVRQNVPYKTFESSKVLQQSVFHSMARKKSFKERKDCFLRRMWQAVLQMRCTLQAVIEEYKGNVLQSPMFWSSFCRSEQPCMAGRQSSTYMQSLRDAVFSEERLRKERWREVLLVRMQRSRASQNQAKETLYMRGLCGVLFDKLCSFFLAPKARDSSLLFSTLCRQFTFTTHEGGWEQQLRSRATTPDISKGLEQGIQGFDSSSGQPQLSSLWAYSSVRKTSVSGSPHRLQSAELGSNELDYSLRAVPRGYAWRSKIPRDVERKTVCSVERAGYEAATYNLRVAPGHNYFAEGILVHNCDDPHNTETEKVVETDADRNKVESWWKELSGTRLNDPKRSAIVVVMQRLHERDLSGVILDSDDEDWTHLMIPMEHDTLRHNVTVKLPQYDDDEPWEDPREEEGELMWPERFGEAEVARIKSRLGTYMAAGRLQQEPVPKGGGIIKRDWWLNWNGEVAQEYGLEWGPARKEFPHFELVVGSVDTSYGRKEENDYNAMTVWGIWLDKAKNRRAMLMYAWAKRLPLRGRLVEAFPGEAKVNFDARQRESFGLIELVGDTCKRYKVRRLLIENKTRGQDVADEIKRLFTRENFGVELLEPVGDKVSRTHSVVPLFNDDAIWAPNTKWAEQVIGQSASFPKADHDDLHDTVTQFLNWARENGLLTLAEESSAMDLEDSRFQHNTRSVAEQYGV